MEVRVDKFIGDLKIDDFFNDDLKGLQLLSGLKWEHGFVCRKCGNENSCDGKVPFSRRCTRCKNEESATSNTLFHNLKFPLSKAFYIAYQVCLHPTTTSAIDMARDLSLRQMTCWNFMHKVENKIARITNLNSLQSVSFQEILISSHESPFI
jgi:hypothetical protein